MNIAISSTYGTPRRPDDIDVFHSVHPLLRFQALNRSISINVFSFLKKISFLFGHTQSRTKQNISTEQNKTSCVTDNIQLSFYLHI